MSIKINPNDKGHPPGKLGDAELLMSDDQTQGQVLPLTVSPTAKMVPVGGACLAKPSL